MRLATVTIRPPGWRSGRSNPVSAKWPRKLVAIWISKPSTDARRGPPLVPALLMSMSRPRASSTSRRASADGFEIQMATNFLGHFALTGLLLPLLHPGGRIVTVASLMARRGHLSAATTLEDLRPREPYRAGRCYADSKQADL